MLATVLGPVTETVCAEVMMFPKYAAEPATAGTDPFQFSAVDQLPSAFVFQVVISGDRV